MPLHVRRSYVRTLEGVVVVDFKCSRCGHEALAAVMSSGTGEETAGALSDPADAKLLAQSRAGHELMQNARDLAAVACCPACRTADDAKLARARTGALVKAGLIAIAPSGLAYAYSVGEGAPFSMVVVVSAGALIAACASFFGSRWRWAETEARVRFLSAAELEAVRAASPLEAPAEPEPESVGFTVALVWGAALSEAKVTRPFASSLRLGLMEHRPDGPAWLTPDELEGRSPDDALELALRTLASDSRGGLTEVEPGVLHGSWGDGFAASRLALPERFRDLALKGRPVSFAASEDTLFLAGEDAPDALLKAFARSRAHAMQVLADERSVAGRFTARPWRLTEQGWEPWAMPASHPLSPRVSALEAELGSNAWRP